MSQIYDNWEKLVDAVVKREEYRKLAYAESFRSSFGSDSDFSDCSASTSSRRFSFDLSSPDGNSQSFPTTSSANASRFSHVPKPPKMSSSSRFDKIFGAARRFVTPGRKRPESRITDLPLDINAPGVTQLMRSELEAVCENFSNVLTSSAAYILFKGTLSNGVDIAVSYMPGEYTNSDFDTKFRKKIENLSKVNHKNFANILGYCAEEKPFTRMMVFEYAPNGTLFEYLHIKECERLDWAKRMRIAMGLAYCLEHMHQRSPPLTVTKLTSHTVYITEDYAAKVSDFDCFNEAPEADLLTNVYSFGIILFEMVTGELKVIVDDGSYHAIRGGRPSHIIVDPTLRTYQEDQFEEIARLIEACTAPDPWRISMKEACTWLSKITGIGPDEAIPISVSTPETEVRPNWKTEVNV